MTQHTDETSSKNLIDIIEVPINVFNNQIFLQTSQTPNYKFERIFPRYHRHIVQETFDEENKFVSILKKYLNPSVVNCINADESVMGKIQAIYPFHFAKYRIRFTQAQVEDITNEEQQNELSITTHRRAHIEEHTGKIRPRY